jgi:hypothetical protein
MFAETMAGIALVKSGVEFIKSNIQTAQDISSFAVAIDNMFSGQEQINKKRFNKSGVGVADQLGIKYVASEVIDAKLAAESMDEMRQLIDNRFGFGTWKSIVDLRAQRIQEQKEAEELARKKQNQANKERDHAIKTSIGIVAATVVIGGMFVAMIVVFTS